MFTEITEEHRKCLKSLQIFNETIYIYIHEKHESTYFAFYFRLDFFPISSFYIKIHLWIMAEV